MTLTIRVNETQMYAPATVELVLPYDATNGAIYTVCQAEVVSVGQALPCLRKSIINAAITYTSKLVLLRRCVVFIYGN